MSSFSARLQLLIKVDTRVSSVQNVHSRILLKCIFVLASNALLRLGEIFIKSKFEKSKGISFEFQLYIPVAILLVLRNLKNYETHVVFQIHTIMVVMKCAILRQNASFYRCLVMPQPVFQFVGG